MYAFLIEYASSSRFCIRPRPKGDKMQYYVALVYVLRNCPTTSGVKASMIAGFEAIFLADTIKHSGADSDKRSDSDAY